VVECRRIAFVEVKRSIEAAVKKRAEGWQEGVSRFHEGVGVRNGAVAW
jgi:hypothetical protein